MSSAGNEAIVAQAATWLVRLECDHSAGARQDWERWYAADPGHAAVWDRMARLQSAIPGGGTAAGAALAAVDFRQGRRRALKLMAVTAGVAVGAGGLYAQAERGNWLADYRTATGEQRQLALGGNVTLMMNTATALDVSPVASSLEIRLYDGEILLDTHHTRGVSRIVTQGGVIALAQARLAVRQRGTDTQLALESGQVQIQTRHRGDGQLSAGEVCRFTANGIVPGQGWAGRHFAWTQGMLIAEDMRLDDFLAELGRYRPGLVQCTPDIAGRRVTGSFRLKNTDQILQALATAQGLQLSYRTRYWVRVSAA